MIAEPLVKQGQYLWEYWAHFLKICLSFLCKVCETLVNISGQSATTLQSL